MSDKQNGDKKPSKHHVIPRSRGGSNGTNVVTIPTAFHENWHQVFGNLTPKEAIEFIRMLFIKKPKKQWRINELYALQLEIKQKTIEKAKKK